MNQMNDIPNSHISWEIFTPGKYKLNYTFNLELFLSTVNRRLLIIAHAKFV